MGELILCCCELAAEPFYLEETSFPVYSLEEVCYYLEKYPDRADERLWGQELCDWLEQALHLTVLADKLRDCGLREAGLSETASVLIDACGYLEPTEKHQLLAQLRELEHQDEFQKRKRRADRELRSRHYAESIHEYAALLRDTEGEALGAGEAGNIWHNLGVAYARLFLYEQAAECLKKAYEYNNNPESLLEMYAAAQFLTETEDAGENEPPLNWRDQVTALMQQARDEAGEEPVMLPAAEQIDLWKKDYRMYTRLLR